MFLFSVPKIFRGKVQEKSDFRVQGSLLKKKRIYFRQWTQGTELLLAESTAVAEEGILLVVVDGAALVALEHVLPAVAAHPGVGRHRGRAPGPLQRLTHRLIDTHS